MFEQRTFVFADTMIWTLGLAIRLSADAAAPTPVYWLGGRDAVPLAPSFEAAVEGLIAEGFA